MDLIRGISGIRGIVNNSLTDSVIIKYAKAFSELQNGSTILVARDTRSSGNKYIDLVTNCLKDCGNKVINCGIIPTPTAQFLIEKNNYDGGIVITASHNPSEWNGMKFIDGDGCFLNKTQNINLFKIADFGQSNHYSNNGSIEVIKNGYVSHVNHTQQLSVINLEAIKEKNFSVVVDAVNGAASEALPTMLEKLGCQVYKINCVPDGKFPRGTEPIPKNLKDLGKAVIKYNADIGFATDPDGDRLAIVDEKGIPIGEEYTLVICADGILKSSILKSPIVTNLSTTMALDDIAENYNSEIVRTEVGEINVVNKMKQLNSELGGEGNGGVILMESHLGRDSLVGATLFLNRLSQSDYSVSKIFESMPQYIMIKDKIQIKTIDPKIALEKIELEFSQVNCDKSDGLKLLWNDSWVHIRQSNTEPIIRIYAESKSSKKIKLIIETIKKLFT